MRKISLKKSLTRYIPKPGAAANIYTRMTWDDALAVMGLKSGSSAAQVRKKLVDLMKAWHPDTNKDSRSHIITQNILKAYAVLKAGKEASKQKEFTSVPFSEYKDLYVNLKLHSHNKEELEEYMGTLAKTIKTLEEDRKLQAAYERALRDMNAQSALHHKIAKQSRRIRDKFSRMGSEEREMSQLIEQAKRDVLREWTRTLWPNLRFLIDHAFKINGLPHVKIYTIKGPRNQLLTPALLIAITTGVYLWDQRNTAYRLNEE